MKMLFYLADFEEMRIVQSLKVGMMQNYHKEFNECDKLALARSLWIHNRNNTKVILNR